MIVTMVRIYLTEGEHHLQRLMQELPHNVRGATVFRGVSGFGHSGKIHSEQWLDLSFDLPLVVEFFDTPEQVAQVLVELRKWLEYDHIVTWDAVITAIDSE